MAKSKFRVDLIVRCHEWGKGKKVRRGRREGGKQMEEETFRYLSIVKINRVSN
uniref:Uncharacterized protein n=1 Tax=Arundo donax TaxID=35708 RepID=A0A0A9HR63_ARUDO